MKIQVGQAIFEGICLEIETKNLGRSSLLKWFTLV